MSGLVDRFNDLPQPAKIGIGGVAIGGVLAIMLSRRPSTPAAVAESAATQASGPIVLPAGASSDNAGELQQNTLSLVQKMMAESREQFGGLLASTQSALHDQLVANQQTNQAGSQTGVCRCSDLSAFVPVCQDVFCGKAGVRSTHYMLRT